jgi:hypothetical protein
LRISRNVNLKGQFQEIFAAWITIVQESIGNLILLSLSTAGGVDTGEK